MAANVNDILAHFDRTADQFLSRDDFRDKLRSGRKLRIKYCVDVTTPTVHIGHAVNLWLLRYMQNQGHKVVFLIGDFTTRIGDPHGRLEARDAVPEEDILKHSQECIDQAGAVLRFDDPALIEVRRNSEWYAPMPAAKMMELFSLVTHARLIARDEFQMRIAQGAEIHVHELLYPILRGYDTVMVDSDLTITGSDQLFNESLGRFLQEKYGKPPQTLITTQITPGINGHHKQSVSQNNHVGVLHSPRDKFGRIMRVPDGLIADYFRIYTDVPLRDIEEMRDLIEKKPRDAKLKLAGAIVERYHGHDVAEAERLWFVNTISKGQIPADLPTLTLSADHLAALDLVQHTRRGKSKGDTRRLLKQGAVELNGQKLENPDQPLHIKSGDILQVGRRNWFRLEIVKPMALDTQRLHMRSLQHKELDFAVAYVPQWEMVKYLGKVSPGIQPDPKAVRELFEKALDKPEPRDEWLWTIARKEEPEKIVGIAHLKRGAKQGNQNVWLAPEIALEPGLMLEILTAVNAHAFRTLGLGTAEFKDAFALATAPPTAQGLYQEQRLMNQEYLNRDNPDGSWGYTKEGWQIMQEWRRTISPWLFENSQIRQPLGRAPLPEPEPAPEAKPAPEQKPAAEQKPVAKPRKRPLMEPEPPAPKPRREREE